MADARGHPPSADRQPGILLYRYYFLRDLTVALDRPGRFPLAIVDLNSAWSHYKGGFTGKPLPAQQFLADLAEETRPRTGDTLE